MINEYRIVISDETKEASLSTVNVSKNVVNTATNTKTVESVNKTFNNQSLKQIGMRSADIVTGGAVSNSVGMMSAVANPMAVALMALTLASQVAKHIEELRKQRLEWNNTMLQAGGSRQNANISGGRVSVLTGRINGQSTVYRR